MALVRIQFRRSRGLHVGIIGTMYEDGIAANVMYHLQRLHIIMIQNNWINVSNELVMTYKESGLGSFKVPSQYLVENSNKLRSLEGTDLWTW
jgi:hypothetical protein